MRVTKHNARGMKGSSQGFSAKHNDRNYDISKADNINVEMSKYNRYLSVKNGKWYSEAEKDRYKTFEEVEQEYYEKHFKHQWEEQQKRHKQKRNYNRMKPFEEWCRNKMYCPEESFIQVGNIDNHISNKLMFKIGREYVRAHQDYCKEHHIKCSIIDVSFHFDEAVPQMHLRRVWYSVKDGKRYIGQNDSLDNSDLQLPYPDKKPGKNNNKKMTFDSDLREILLDICERNGLEVEREPQEGVEHNLSKKGYLAKKSRELEKENRQLSEENGRLKNEVLQNENMILLEAERIKKAREQSQQNRIQQAQELEDSITENPQKSAFSL